MFRTAILGAALVAATLGHANADDDPQFGGKWRLVRQVTGPWADANSYLPPDDLIGRSIGFRPGFVDAVDPIGCGKATFTNYETPIAGLFQGAELTKNDALELGLAGENFKSFSVNCNTGLFEYHWADAQTLLLGLDNRVWTISRTDGTRAAKASPEGVVQRFLEAHFDGDMSFSPEAIAAKKSFFTPALKQKIAAYLALPQSPDEAPSINGDPFTDSQDYPARFAVRGAANNFARADVPVDYSDAGGTKRVSFIMFRKNKRWLIDDLEFADGTRLKDMLAE